MAHIIWWEILFLKKVALSMKQENCILVDPSKKHKEWAKYIKKLVENPEYIYLLQNNLHEFVKDRYDIRNVTKNRADWYRQISKK